MEGGAAGLWRMQGRTRQQLVSRAECSLHHAAGRAKQRRRAGALTLRRWEGITRGVGKRWKQGPGRQQPAAWACSQPAAALAMQGMQRSQSTA